ncbi:COG2 [Bugula neritina]|uniref:COG2 n=1 Tax=Bugula neritina TaxID=10212 RepID=A0A7J7JPF1_BUGNE|nr:COG2 [Bugula neritina]
MFTEGLTTSNDEMLTRCLRTYVTIDKIADAESLFRRVEVKPYMEEYINESYIRQKGGSFAMYSKILEFQKLKCDPLLAVIKPKSGQEPVKGYDFMVNAVWPEVVDLLETKAMSIFAAGNPENFYKEYTDGMEFLSSFELQCATIQSVKRLRVHPSYGKFINKWSLPVYFQIRLQDIAGTMEKCFLTPWTANTENSVYSLSLSHTVQSCIEKCWRKGVFLPSLAHRFWKLTLQILARYRTWLSALCNGEVEIECVVDKPALPRPSSRVDMLKSTDGRASPQSRSESPSSVTEFRKPNSDELVQVVGMATNSSLVSPVFYRPPFSLPYQLVIHKMLSSVQYLRKASL